MGEEHEHVNAFPGYTQLVRTNEIFRGESYFGTVAAAAAGFPTKTCAGSANFKDDRSTSCQVEKCSRARGVSS